MGLEDIHKTVLREDVCFLKEELDVSNSDLLDILYQESAISQEEQEIIEKQDTRRRQNRKLISYMERKPLKAFNIFMSAVPEHVKQRLEKLLQKEKQRLLDLTAMETSNEDESTDEDESMDEGSDGDSTSETEEEEEEEACCSRKLVPIQSFILDSTERRVDVHVMVIGEPERKTDSKMKAVVADKTSAVDLWIYDDTLFKHFSYQAGIVLRNVRWNGRILETNNRSSAKVASVFKIPGHIIAEALGTGQPISTKRANALPELRLMCLKGKVVKKSFLLIRPCYQKILKHCQIKLKDDKGFVNVDVWGDAAEAMERGIVIKMTRCRKREPWIPDGPPFTTTSNTLVKRLSSSELKQINVEKLYRRGTLQAFDVEMDSDIRLASDPQKMTRVEIDMLRKGGNLDTVMQATKLKKFQRSHLAPKLFFQGAK